jgi:hypothetical protein
MRLLKMRILFAIFIFLIPVISSAEIVSEKPIFLVEPVKAHVSSWGDLMVAFVDKDLKLNLKNITQGWSVQINTSDLPGSEPGGIGLDTEGDSIYITWRSKKSRKEVHFRASYDRGKTWSDVKKINTWDKALTPIGLDAEGDNVGVVWPDEGGSFHVAMNYSKDRGKDFLEEEINVSKGYSALFEPALFLDKGKSLVFFNGSKERINYLVLKTSADVGKTWKEEILSETTGISDNIHPIRIGNRLLVFWRVSLDGIMGAYSDSDGETWKILPFKDTRSLDVGSVRVACTKNGDVFVTFFASKGSKDKTRIYLYQSHDSGTTWSDMKRMDDTPFDLTRSVLPEIVADEEGRVALVWQDYRNIRSNIYMKYSLDYGKTWTANDISLEEEGKYNTAFPSIEMIKGCLYVIAWRYTDDTVREAHLYLFPEVDLGGRS